MPSMYDDTDAETNPLGDRMAQLHDKMRRILAQLLVIRSESAKYRLADVGVSLDLNLSKVWKPTIDSRTKAQLLGVNIPGIARNKRIEKRAAKNDRGLLEPPKALSRAKGRGHREQMAAR